MKGAVASMGRSLSRSVLGGASRRSVLGGALSRAGDVRDILTSTPGLQLRHQTRKLAADDLGFRI